MTPQNMLLIGGGSVLVLYLLSQKPADDAIGGAGAAVEKEKKPEEPVETIFITTEQKAAQIKKEVTAPATEWESLYETMGQYGEQRPGYLATGAYERMSGALKVLGPTHAGSKYYEQMGYKKLTPTGGRILRRAGRAERVAAWKAKHGEPTYSGTGHRVKV